MFNVKAGAIGAGIAAAISLLLGLFSGATAGYIFLRMLIFALLFFGIVNGVWIVLRRFMPDVFEDAGESIISGESDGATGQKVDLSVGDDEAPIFIRRPEANPRTVADGDDEPDDVDELPSDDEGSGDSFNGEDAANTLESEKHLDHSGEGGYTGSEDTVADAEEIAPARPIRHVPIVEDVDQLPDLQLFSDAFVTPILEDSVVESASGNAPSSSSPSASPVRSGAKAGDFQTQEMVSAIQTMLKKDQKG